MEKNHINIIGAGASGLFAAVEFHRSGWIVALYYHKHRAACKLFLAGQSGLIITKDEPLRSFSKNYGVNENIFYELLSEF